MGQSYSDPNLRDSRREEKAETEPQPESRPGDNPRRGSYEYDGVKDPLPVASSPNFDRGIRHY